MANSQLNTYLEQIKTERFAKDMRYAIHDAIKQIAKDTYTSLNNYEQRVQEALTTTTEVNNELKSLINAQGDIIYRYAKIIDGWVFDYVDDDVAQSPRPNNIFPVLLPSNEKIKLCYNSGLDGGGSGGYTDDEMFRFDLYGRPSNYSDYVYIGTFPGYRTYVEGERVTEIEITTDQPFIALKVQPVYLVPQGTPQNPSISLSLYLSETVEESEIFVDPNTQKLIDYISNVKALDIEIDDAHSMNQQETDYVYANETYSINIFKGAEYILNVNTNAQSIIDNAQTPPIWSVYISTNNYIGSVYLIHSDSTETLLTRIPILGLSEFCFKTTDYSVKDVTGIRFNMTPEQSPISIVDPNLDISATIVGDHTPIDYIKDYIAWYFENRKAIESLAKTSWDSTLSIFNQTPRIDCVPKGHDLNNLYNTIHYITANDDYYPSQSAEAPIILTGQQSILITVPDYYNRNDSSSASPHQLLIVFGNYATFYNRYWDPGLSEWSEFEPINLLSHIPDGSIRMNKLHDIYLSGEYSPIIQTVTDKIPTTYNVLASIGGHSIESGTVFDSHEYDGTTYELNGTYQLIGNYCLMSGTVDVRGGYTTTTYNLPVACVSKPILCTLLKKESSDLDTIYGRIGLYGGSVVSFSPELDGTTTFTDDETYAFTICYKYQ